MGSSDEGVEIEAGFELLGAGRDPGPPESPARSGRTTVAGALAVVGLLATGWMVFRPSEDPNAAELTFEDSDDEEPVDSAPPDSISTTTVPVDDGYHTERRSEVDEVERHRAELARAMKSDAELAITGTTSAPGSDAAPQGEDASGEGEPGAFYVQIEGVRPGTPVLGRDVDSDLLVDQGDTWQWIDLDTGAVLGTWWLREDPVLFGDSWVALRSGGGSPGVELSIARLDLGAMQGTDPTPVDGERLMVEGTWLGPVVASSDSTAFWAFGRLEESIFAAWHLIDVDTGAVVRTELLVQDARWNDGPEVRSAPSGGVWVLDDPRNGEYEKVAEGALIAADQERLLVATDCTSPADCDVAWLDDGGAELDLSAPEISSPRVAVLGGGAFVVEYPATDHPAAAGSTRLLVGDRRWQVVELENVSRIDAPPDGSFAAFNGIAGASLYDPELDRVMELRGEGGDMWFHSEVFVVPEFVP